LPGKFHALVPALSPMLTPISHENTQPPVPALPLPAGSWDPERASPKSPAASPTDVRLGVYMSLLVTLRAKHAPTAAHCMRVAQSLTAWGLFHRLPHAELAEIELAGLLHDIGKVGIPERILQKPSPLLPEERTLIEIHSQVGVEILRAAGVKPAVVESIRRLGTWFDQSNQRGEKVELPIIQRILSIVDAFDSMTSEQTYRRAMSRDKALGELRRMSGRQFDPLLVDTFVETVMHADRNLHRLVQERWQSIDPSHSLIHLFDSSSSKDCGGSTIIQSLNSVFHRKMMDHMNDGVIFVDTEFRILDWNQAAERITGVARTAVLHLQWEPELIGLSDQRGQAIDIESCPIRAALRSGKSATHRFRIQPPDGRHLKIEAQLMPIFDDRGILRGGAMLMGDASDQADLEERVLELHTQATQDPLTKVFNRAELNRRLPLFVNHSQASGKCGSVLICDIDFFKRINDTFGHPAGDDALRIFASVLQKEARETDIIARYGGEEFVILCDDCDLASAVDIAEAIRLRLQRTPISALKGKRITASFGVAEILPTDEAEAALDRADRALLRAKQTGRDRVISLACTSSDSRSQQAVEIYETGTQSTLSLKGKGSWLTWIRRVPTELGQQKHQPIVKAELISPLPRDILFKKVKGFLDEWSSRPKAKDEDTLHVRIDFRYAPLQLRSTDRPAMFEMKIRFEEVEVAGHRCADILQRQTRIFLEISSVRRRDRRSAAILDQANRLKRSFQSFSSTTVVDDGLRNRIIPVFRPDSDAR
jgi:diguanylate cyclase (GGDEF)-like protein/PAS domain S-box-containing protein/putative nucleotidyltransferase with HDIG domain